MDWGHVSTFAMLQHALHRFNWFDFLSFSRMHMPEESAQAVQLIACLSSCILLE